MRPTLLGVPGPVSVIASMSTMMKAAILMLLAVICGRTDAQNYSKKAWDYVATYNGAYNNIRRIKEGFTKHNPIRVFAKPVSAPALGPGPMMLLEVGEPDVIQFRHVAVPSEGEDNVLKMTIYNFTGSSGPSLGQFNTDLLVNYTKDDFWNLPGCVAGLEMLGSGFFFGDWPICSHVVEGKHPTWGIILTCNHTSVTIPVGADEDRNFVPYDMILAGPKFPLINPPPGYVSPCDRQPCS